MIRSVGGSPGMGGVTPPGRANAPSPAIAAKEAKLTKAAQGLQGVFVQQLFKAMRSESSQQEGFVTGGPGEDIFTGMLDEQIANEMPKHWKGGLTDALTRQLRRAAQAELSAPSASSSDPVAHP